MIDQFIEGLEVLGFIDVMRAFPQKFHTMFVFQHLGICPSVEELLDLLQDPPGELSSQEKQTMDLLRRYITLSDVNGQLLLLLCCCF